MLEIQNKRIYTVPRLSPLNNFSALFFWEIALKRRL